MEVLFAELCGVSAVFCVASLRASRKWNDTIPEGIVLVHTLGQLEASHANWAGLPVASNCVESRRHRDTAPLKNRSVALREHPKRRHANAETEKREKRASTVRHVTNEVLGCVIERVHLNVLLLQRIFDSYSTHVLV
jgi:hypothetical protein